MGNAADQRQVRKAKQGERLKREQELNDIRITGSTRAGRRHLWRLLAAAGCFRQSFVPGQSDGTAFNEGRRSIGLMVLADLHEANPALYLLMANEAKDDEQRSKPLADEPLTDEPLPITEESEDA